MSERVNEVIGCPGDDPSEAGPGGHEQDELTEPLTPPEDDPEGEFADDEQLLEKPLPDHIEPATPDTEGDDEA